MTTQSAIAAQSFGTSTNVGDNLFSISPLTIAAGTTAFVVSMQVTRTTAAINPGQIVRVFYTTTMRTVSAGDAPWKLGQTARYVELDLAKGALITIKDSTLEPVTGSLFHCWVSAPNLTAAATLDVDLVELP